MPSVSDFDLLQFERPFWEPLGQFVVKFGYLEMRVDWAIGGLLRIHDRQGEAVAPPNHQPPIANSAN